MKLFELLKVDINLTAFEGFDWKEEISCISSLDSLQKNSLVFIKNSKFLKKLEHHIDLLSSFKVGLIVDEKFFNGLNNNVKDVLVEKAPWVLLSSNISLSLTLLSKPFYDQKMGELNSQVDGRQMGTTSIDPSALISQGVFIGEHVKIEANVEVMPGSVILPHSIIEKNTKIYPNVTIYPFTHIGQNCRIHSGTVIGSDGYGYTFHQGQHIKIWHMGGVVIENDVEIGSNSSIDMGTFSPTIIGTGTRIDNLVQIAHNVKIGRSCIICGQAGVAGSAVLEDYVVLAGRAAIGPDAFIGKGTQVAGGAKVNEGAAWPAGSKLAGHPAKDIKEWMRGVAYLRNVSLRNKTGI